MERLCKDFVVNIYMMIVAVLLLLESVSIVLGDMQLFACINYYYKFQIFQYQFYNNQKDIGVC